MAGTAEPARAAPRSLIASDRVIGTDVRRTDGTRVGRIERLMVDKASGRVAYAVMTFGGFLGLGEDFHTPPWAMLRFEPRQDAYVVDITENQRRPAPPRSPEGTDPGRGQRLGGADPPLRRRGTVLGHPSYRGTGPHQPGR